ncbi:hypothetical protein [Rhizobium sp. WYCCWR10014]|uniref:hypothetical protein n=1 Tax=Rhizobium sp. WYCCWR10014 TaxID=1825933 RepID=UPI001FDA75EC|nr:hypothetical protein [Rhizobium sp. WYCCWR10014]
MISREIAIASTSFDVISLGALRDGLAGSIMQIAFDLGNLVQWVVLEAALVLPLAAIVAVASKRQFLKILAKDLSAAWAGSATAPISSIFRSGRFFALSARLGVGDFFSRGPLTMLVPGSLSVLTALVSWIMVERPVMAWSKKADEPAGCRMIG